MIAVLLFACNRVTVKRNLDQLIKFRPNASSFPIVVSQDCNHDPTKRIIESYGHKITFIQQPDQSDIVLQGKAQKKFKGYYKISRHYGWALNHTFNHLNYDTVLIVEDDLDISPDFFEYFQALYPVLKADPTVYCVSAWNDNGKDGLVQEDPSKYLPSGFDFIILFIVLCLITAKLYRSDFFPGLGWMLTKDLWMEFQNKWPKALVKIIICPDIDCQCWFALDSGMTGFGNLNNAKIEFAFDPNCRAQKLLAKKVYPSKCFDLFLNFFNIIYFIVFII